MSPRVILVALIVLATGGFVIGTTLERNSGESKHESAATLRAEGVSAAADTSAGRESNAIRAAEPKRGGAPAPPATTTLAPRENGASHAGEHTSAATPNTQVEAGTGRESGGKPTEGKPSERPSTHAAERTPTAGTSTALPTSPHHAELKPLGINVEAVPFVALAALGSLALGLAAWLRPRTALLLVGVGAAMLLFGVLDVREVFHQSDESKTGLTVLAAAIAAVHAAAAAVAGLMARRANTGDHAAAGATMAT
jgi:hypothetical protein